MGLWKDGKVTISFIPDSKRLARLKKRLVYISDEGKLWVAEPNMIFDGASIPRCFYWLIGSPFTGYYRRWAVIHDAYYKDHRGRNRKEVDLQFKKGIMEDGVGKIKATLIYSAVRVGGRKSWQK